MIIDLVHSPAPEEWLLVPELDVEVAAQKKTEDAIFDALDQHALQVVRCPNCDRIWIQKERDSNAYEAYRPESKDSGGPQR
jgi:hypothetical protein